MPAAAIRINAGWVLAAPFLALVLGLYLWPIAQILWLGVTDPEPGLGNYAKLFEGDTLARILWTTLRTCLITTVLSVVLGYWVAYAMVHAGEGARGRMVTLLLLSFWISVLVRTFAWLMLLGRNGPVNNALTGLGLVAEPVEFMRSETGVLIGMVHYMIPYAVLPLLSSMQALDGRLMSASLSLGATRTQGFLRVWLPLTLPGIVAASLLVFILSLGFYVTPAILGGGKVLMVAEYISVQILVTNRWGTAAMLATLMLGGVLAMVFLMSRFMRLGAVFGGGGVR